MQVGRVGHLRCENGEGDQGAEEAQADPVGGEFADAKVQDDEVQLLLHGQAGSPDVHSCFAPQLHWAAGPPVLLLAVGKEAGRQLHEESIMSCCACLCQLLVLPQSTGFCLLKQESLHELG